MSWSRATSDSATTMSESLPSSARGMTRRRSAGADATSTCPAKPCESRNRVASRRMMARRSGESSAYGEVSTAGRGRTGGGARGAPGGGGGAARREEADVAGESEGARLVGSDDDQGSVGVGHRRGDAADGAAREAAASAVEAHPRRAGADVGRQDLEGTRGVEQGLGHEKKAIYDMTRVLFTLALTLSACGGTFAPPPLP